MTLRNRAMVGGYIMASSDNGGPRDNSSKKPTGQAHPSVNSTMSGNGGGTGGNNPPKDPKYCKLKSDKPMEVVFTSDTFKKLIVWTLGPLLAVVVTGISAFFFFYHKTMTHIENSTIHLTSGERIKLETRAEAIKARTSIQRNIINHFNLKIREVKVEQQEQARVIADKLKVNAQNVADELKDLQQKQLNKILSAVK